jgi:aminoglycoside phosphotransferase (APT) family kinase protein
MSESTASFDITSSDWTTKLQAYLQRFWGRSVQLSGLRRFPAGLSWITVGMTAQAGPLPGQTETLTLELILRIGDPAGLLAPYSAEPEYLALTALTAVSGLPIPQAYAYSDDHSIIGAPFLVTQRVEGDTPQPWRGADQVRGETATHTLGLDFTTALAAIHGFDWSASPLHAWLGEMTPANAAQLQIRRWAEHAGMPSPQAHPQMHYTMRWLQAHAPVAERITVVHGDYRVGNFLQQNGRITAMLDWELVHLGDPHEDIAWAGMRMFAGGTQSIGGLIDRNTFYADYQAHTGFVVRPEVVRYYEVLAQFKMAAMLVGAVRRADTGHASDVRMAAMGCQLPTAMLALNRMIEEYR